jgi:hypothetical protein
VICSKKINDWKGSFYKKAALWILLLPVMAATAWSQPGYYRVSAKPGGVQVFINDARSDSAGMLDPGTYAFRIDKEGYRAAIRSVTIESDRVAEIRVHLLSARPRLRAYPKRYNVRLRRTTASLILSSNPPGLPVRLNDDEKGSTPLRLDDVPTGEYRVTIGRVSETVELQSDEMRRLRLEKGAIHDVTKEIYDLKYEHVRLHTFSAFMEEDEARARNCSLFRECRGASAFRLTSRSMYLVTRMIFRNSGEVAIAIPLQFPSIRAQLCSRAPNTPSASCREKTTIGVTIIKTIGRAANIP